MWVVLQLNFEWLISSTQFNHPRITNPFSTRHKSIKALTWNGTTTELQAVRCKKLLTPILSAMVSRCLPFSQRLGLKKVEEGRRICYTRAYLHQDYTLYAAARLGRISANNSFNMVAWIANFECCTMMCHRYQCTCVQCSSTQFNHHQKNQLYYLGPTYERRRE